MLPFYVGCACCEYRRVDGSIYLSDATHIFDGLDKFPTHVAHLRFGAFVVEPTKWPMVSAPTLHALALEWLKEDRDHRRTLESQGRKRRGARRDQVP